GVDGFDLLGKAGGVGLERGDPRIEALQVDQRQELRFHSLSDCIRGPRVNATGHAGTTNSDCPQSGATRKGCPRNGATSACIRPPSIKAGLEAPATILGPPGLEPRPNRL